MSGGSVGAMGAAGTLDVATRLDVLALYADYVACLDEARMDDWPAFFTEDAHYRIVPRENHDRGLPLATVDLVGQGMLKDRVYGVTSTLFHAPYYQRHVVGPVRILGEVEGQIRAEASYLVIRTKRDQPSEVFNAGRYIDRIVREPGSASGTGGGGGSSGGGLRFREKICVFDSELIPNSLIYPV